MHKTTEEKIKELRTKIDELEKSLKVEDFEYPICKKGAVTGVIVLFYTLDSGTVLATGERNSVEVGDRLEYETPHTNQSIWEDYPYDKERDLHHKQMVYCWDDEDYTYGIEVRFYDAINKCTFSYDGYSYGADFEKYSATMPEFMLEAHKTLKD